MTIDLSQLPPVNNPYATATDPYARAGDYTDDGYPTEKDSVQALMELLDRIDVFHVHQEVCGEYMAHRLGAESACPRVDVFALPKPSLQQQGWTLGAIAIECKRGSEKVGRPISQMVDYRSAAFRVRGIDVVPRRVFLWPLSRSGGPVASILAQHQLGGASGHNGGLILTVGQERLAEIDADGRLILDSRRTAVGKRRGSR